MRARQVARVGLALASTLLVSEVGFAYQEPGSERVDYTAYTLRARELSLGPFKAELGIFPELMVGTYVPTWFAFPVLHSPIPTGYVKLRDPFRGPVAASFRATFVYIDADALASDLSENEGTNADLLVVPLELAVSARYTRKFSQSLELSYVFADAFAQQASGATIRGAGALSHLTLSTLFELRLTRVFALTLLGRLLLYQSAAHVRAQFEQGSTSVDADLGVKALDRAVTACAVPGVSFSWAHVNLELGLGYGAWWLPVVELPVPGRLLVPEGNIYVRF
jgi:hypothetical protein